MDKHMRNKGSDEPNKSAEEIALEQKVDAMMSTKPVPLPPPTPTPKPSSPPEPVSATPKPKVALPSAPELKTAPALPEAEAKPYKLKTPEKPPIVISLADDSKSEPVASTLDKPTATPDKVAVPTALEDKLPDDPLEDGATDKAVDEIVAKEGDTLLALDDAKAAHKQPKQPTGWKQKLGQILRSKRTWVIVALLLIVLMAIPTTRYKLTGLIIKKPVTIVVVDSKTTSPVSGATVELDGKSVLTDAYGKARLKASVGPHSLVASKRYYKSLTTSYFVGFRAAPSLTNIRLEATGRLVPVLVTNKITGKPLSGAQIKVLGTNTKTNSKGQAVIALPTATTSLPADIALSGYNTAKANILITDKFVKQNSFELTPSGHIYFLSNLSGKIDVVRSDLDGSNRKTVLAGTGQESASTTSLLASRDWRYLVLKARRDSVTPALYLIDTSTDKISQFDNSDSDFSLIGWYGHSFMYDLSRNNVANWQAGHEQLKSYDADNKQLNQLDQNQAEGDSTNYVYQEFYNFYIVNGGLVYNTQWYSFGSADLTGKTDSIRAVQASGQNKKDYQTFTSSTNDYMQAKLYDPQAVYFLTHSNSDNKTTYYEFTGQAVKTANIDSNTFAADYPTYLISPSGNKTLWTEPRDGKNTLFIGDDEAQNKKQIASLSEYSPYGWFSDDYILVAKANSELYIMPVGGLPSTSKPLKITDYYKPVQTYAGYGYGYGGL